MPPRTTREARRDFEQAIAPRANDYLTQRGRALLAAAEERAKQHADGYIAQREKEALALRDEALRELTAVRDEYDRLAAIGHEGRTEARAFGAQLTQLQQRQMEAEARLERAQAIVDDIAKVEESSVDWFDDLTERMPHLRADFPW